MYEHIRQEMQMDTTETLPQTLTDEELMHRPDFYNYVEMGLTWTVILRSGWSYSGRQGQNIGHLCDGTEKLNPVYFYH